MRSILLVLALLLIVSTAQAQQNEWWSDGCDERAIALLEPVSDTFDYAAMCTVYRACDPNDEGLPSCQLHALDALLRACAPDNRHCHDTAVLFAAAVQAFDKPFEESIYEIPSMDIIRWLPRAIDQFEQGNDAEALEAFQQISPEMFNAMPPISRAVVYIALDQPDAALAELDHALSLMLHVPLARYVRAPLLGSLGRADEASFDAVWLHAFAYGDEVAERMVAPLVEAYPLDATRMESWAVYPVISSNSGPAGTFYTDLTAVSPVAITLGIYDELDVALGLGFYEVLGSMLELRADVIILEEIDGGYEFSRTEQFGDAGTSVTLLREGDIYTGSSNLYFFEGGGTTTFMLGSPSGPDPREGLHGGRCGVLSRLRPGIEGVTPYYGGNGYIALFDAPNGTEIGQAERVTILNDATCEDGELWWAVRAEDGTEAWAREYEGNFYAINPASHDPNERAEQRHFYCANTPDISLVIGQRGRVIAGLGANNLRAEPKAAAAEVGSIPEGKEFSVLDGPLCADGYVWWQVDYEGVVGWTAEGQGRTYWLEPILE